MEYCETFRGASSAQGYGFYPKRCCDISKCELARAIRITANTCEFISFIAPRKGESFQEDLYPECQSEEPA
jgi:coronin-1B/1C/6